MVDDRIRVVVVAQNDLARVLRAAQQIGRSEVKKRAGYAVAVRSA